MNPLRSLLLLCVAATITCPFKVRSEEGFALTSELNCTACHSSTKKQAEWLSPKAGPRLAGVGSRVSADWLQRYLSSPQTVVPGTTMPGLPEAMSAADRASAAELLTHHLLSLAPVTFRRVLPDRAAVERGGKLYHSIGCVACHAPQNQPATATNNSPLPRLEEKWAFDGLRRFLRDPLVLRPSGRMPAMNLTDGEAADLAHYLLRETRVAAPLEVARYRGRIGSLEELDTAELARTGPASNFTLESMGRDRGYALRFTGWLRVETAGQYTFHFNVTGAGRLSVDEQWLLGEDSWQREQVDAKSTVQLSVGWHPVGVDYVQRGSKEPSLKLEWEGPGIAREVVPSSLLQSSREAVAAPEPLVVDATKAAKGSALYAQLNCAACHEENAPANPPPALALLDASRGCLSEMPQPKAPDFHLTSAQRDALRQTVARLKSSDLPSPSSQQRVSHTMTVLNCAACHARNGVGGVRPERDGFFTSNGEDLGEEGRLPPRLDGVGDRLRPEWLSKVLSQGAGVRPYLNTRMPQFGARNVEHLTDLFLALDRRARPLQPAPDAADAQRDAGRQLVGTDGLSCIACHRFNRQPAQALQVIDLTTTTGRLNEDWFRQFLRDPNRFHPGTRMPAFWPEGVSALPSLLGGSTDRQHAALWTYLADGTQAKFPEGLSRQNMELIVGGEAVVYRGKLWEAGFRAIATGYPGQVNAAFDAEEMRMALLWQGRFLDAGPHWGVQGMGRIRPQGTGVVVFPHGTALAVLSDANTAWPAETNRAAGMKFRGVQLDKLKRPTFLYSFHDTEVEDFLTPIENAGKAGFRRTVKFSNPPPAGLHMRIAAGKFKPEGDHGWRLNDALTLHLSEGANAFVRGSGENQELLVPILTQGGKNQLEVEYVW